MSLKMNNRKRGDIQSREDVDREKERLKQKALHIIELGCPGDWESCCFGYCQFYKMCHKNVFTYDKLPTRLIRLKSLIKNLSSKYNSVNGRSNPTNLGQNHFEIAKTLLGQDVMQHELVKDKPNVKKRIGRCTTLNQILRILKYQTYQIPKKRQP